MKTLTAIVLAMNLFGCASLKEAPIEPESKESQETPTPPKEPVNMIPVILIEGEKNTLTFLERNEVPVRTAAVDDIATIAQQYAAAQKPTVVAIDASRLRERKYLTAPELKEIKKQTGVEKKPNPKYKRAKDAVDQAESALREAESTNEDIGPKAAEMTKTPNVGSWGVALGAGLDMASKANLANAKKMLANAKSTLADTEQVIEVPVYATAKAPTASQVTEKTGEITAYVINGAAQSARAVRIPVQQETRATYEYDPGKDNGSALSVSPSAPVSHQLSVQDIVKQSATAPSVSLEDAVKEVKTERERFTEAASPLDQQRAETTSQSLAVLRSMAGSAGKPSLKEDETARAATSDSTGSGPCRTETSSLSEKLKPTGLSMIDDIREKIIAIDIVAAMREATKQGYTHSQAIQASIDQAKEMKKTSADAARAAAQVSVSEYADDEFLAHLGDGTLLPENCESGISGPSMCISIATRMQAVANSVIAGAMACHDQHGSWPE
jgi:hypothetical protein